MTTVADDKVYIGKHIIRTSDRGTFKRCRTLWDFTSKIRQDYEPNRTIRELHFGTAIHSGLEAFYDVKTWHLHNPSSGVILVARAQAAFREAFTPPMNRYGEPERDPEIVTEYNNDVQLGLAMLRDYLYYSLANDNFTPIYNEIEFEVVITTLDGSPLFCKCHSWPVVYQGRIDMVVRDQYGNYWIVDHKTISKLDGFDWLDMDPQGISYAWAIQHQLGISVAGVVYNQLLKSSPKEPKLLKSGKLSVDKSQNATYKTFTSAIDKHGLAVADYTDFLEYLKANERQYYRRIQVQHSQQAYETLGRHVAAEAEEMVNPELAIYPNASNFNCGRCAFRPPCQALHDGSDYEYILEEMYVKRGSKDVPLGTA